MGLSNHTNKEQGYKFIKCLNSISVYLSLNKNLKLKGITSNLSKLKKFILSGQNFFYRNPILKALRYKKFLL